MHIKKPLRFGLMLQLLSLPKNRPKKEWGEFFIFGWETVYFEIELSGRSVRQSIHHFSASAYG